MTTPRSPKSPARKKARVWKAWAVMCPPRGRARVGLVQAVAPSPSGQSIFDKRCQAELWAGKGPMFVIPVEIREILPAPVPPRSRKGGGR